jgi:predicted Zn-dependent protease
MCLLAAVMLLGACSTVPVTERRQLSLIPSDQILSLSFQQYDKFLSEHKVVTGTSESRMVKEVGKRISQAVEDYMRKNGQEDLLQGYAWEFNLVEDKQANAFCMPGGKVVVYTGIFKHPSIA